MPRKIDELRRGRVYWQPGENHPLDVLYDEQDQLRARLPEELTRLQAVAHQTEQRLVAIVEALASGENPAGLVTSADHVAHREIVKRFHDRKHYSHLQAQFAIQRYKRLLGRLTAIGAALDLANSLLKEEEVLSPEYLATWKIGPDDDQPQEIKTDEEPEPAPPMTPEERRLQHIQEPLDMITGSTEQSRRLLTEFENRLPDLRRQLATGQGWFEIFIVQKRHYKEEVVAYAKALKKLRKRNVPIPAEVEARVHPQVRELIEAGVEKFPQALRNEVYNFTPTGPYVKYRWREDREVYSISLGLVDDYPPFPFVPEGF